MACSSPPAEAAAPAAAAAAGAAAAPQAPEGRFQPKLSMFFKPPSTAEEGKHDAERQQQADLARLQLARQDREKCDAEEAAKKRPPGRPRKSLLGIEPASNP